MNSCVLNQFTALSSRYLNKNVDEPNNLIIKIFLFLSVSSIFVGCTGFFQTYAGYVLLGTTPSIPGCIAVFLMTFSVYNLNKLSDTEEDAINLPERDKFLRGRKDQMFRISIVAYALSAVFAFIDTPLSVPVVFIPILANLLYSSKLIPFIPRLKDIPVMKNLFVAVSWALVCTLIPAVHSGVSWECVPLTMAFMIARVFINTALFDIRDVDGDRANGIRTIPVIIGSGRTTALLLAINTIVLIGMNTSLLPWTAHAPTGTALTEIMTIYGYAFITYFRKRRNPLALDLFVDGEWMIGCLAFMMLMAIILA